MQCAKTEIPTCSAKRTTLCNLTLTTPLLSHLRVEASPLLQRALLLRRSGSLCKRRCYSDSGWLRRSTATDLLLMTRISFNVIHILSYKPLSSVTRLWRTTNTHKKLDDLHTTTVRSSVKRGGVLVICHVRMHCTLLEQNLKTGRIKGLNTEKRQIDRQTDRQTDRQE